MSNGPTEQFYPVPKVVAYQWQRGVMHVLNTLGALLILTGLLIWIWSDEWRWAATGAVLAAALWFVSAFLDQSTVSDDKS